MVIWLNHCNLSLYSDLKILPVIKVRVRIRISLKPIWNSSPVPPSQLNRLTLWLCRDCGSSNPSILCFTWAFEHGLNPTYSSLGFVLSVYKQEMLWHRNRTVHPSMPQKVWSVLFCAFSNNHPINQPSISPHNPNQPTLTTNKVLHWVHIGTLISQLAFL